MEILGALLALIGGITNGSYPTPKNKIASWSDGHSWSLFSLFAFFIIPLIIMAANLDELRLLSIKSIEVLVVSGLLFSFGMICFTLSLKKIGLGPSFSLNIILNTSLGTLLPLFLFHIESTLSLSSLFIYTGIVLFVLSIILLSRSLRTAGDAVANKDKVLGVFLGIASGILTSIQSTAYNYAIKDLAEDDLPLLLSKLTVWSLFFMAAFLPFFIFHFSSRENPIGVLKQHASRNIFMISVMSCLYYLSIMLFSWSTNYISVPVAWPIFMTSIVLTTNYWSNKNKELTGVKRKCYRMYLMTTLAAFLFFSLSMRLGY